VLVTCGALGLDPEKLSLADYAGAIFHHNLAHESPDEADLGPPDWDWFDSLPKVRGE
jgi:hypothetical protein